MFHRSVFLFIAICSTAWGANLIHVTLFGQPCTLSGALPPDTLSTIHAIGPEQIPVLPSLAEARQAREKLGKATSLPSELETYRDKQLRRLSAQIEFWETWENVRKTERPDRALLKVAEKNMRSRSLPGFRAALKRGETARPRSAKNKAPSSSALPDVQELYSVYSDGIEANPEKDFHDATEKRMGLRYQCESEADPDASDSDSD